MSAKPAPRTSSASTSSSAASPARILASPAPGPVWPASAAGCGENTRASFASYDPDSSSWKTSQRCLLEGWESYSGTWPRAGMTRSGTAFPLAPSAPLTRGIASGLLPTPAATEAGSNQNGINGKGGEHERPSAGTPTLYTLARHGKLPTPSATMADKGGRGELVGAIRGTKGCRTEAMRLPTPRARDWKGDGKDCLPTALGTGGSLHPRFVEWMMGFPLGWTDEAGDDETGTG